MEGSTLKSRIVRPPKCSVIGFENVDGGHRNPRARLRLIDQRLLGQLVSHDLHPRHVEYRRAADVIAVSVAVNHVTNRLVEAALELIAKPFGRFYGRRIGDQNPFRPHQEHAHVHVVLVAIQGVRNRRDFLDDGLLSENARRDDAEEKKR